MHPPLSPKAEPKQIAVFFDDPGFNDYPFDDPEFRQNYLDIAAMLEKKGGQLCIVRNENTYLGGTIFAGGWCHKDGEFVRTELPIHADLLWNKGSLRADEDIRIINHHELVEICTDKWKTFGLFSHHCPMTKIVPSRNRLKKALRDMVEARIVAKPIDGGEGEGVMIGTAEEVAEAPHSYPLMLQEFIDTSGGIPGIVEGSHDFRIFIIRGEIAASYVRTPPDGSLVANVSQGGKEIPVEPSAIPEAAMAIFTDVDSALSHFENRIYSIDMGLDRRTGQWKIIELNAMPGPPAPVSPNYAFFLEKITDALMLS